MKIEFKDNSYIECKKNETGNVVIVVQAREQDNPRKKITNMVEMTIEEFKKLIIDI